MHECDLVPMRCMYSMVLEVVSDMGVTHVYWWRPTYHAMEKI